MTDIEKIDELKCALERCLRIADGFHSNLVGIKISEALDALETQRTEILQAQPDASDSPVLKAVN